MYKCQLICGRTLLPYPDMGLSSFSFLCWKRPSGVLPSLATVTVLFVCGDWPWSDSALASRLSHPDKRWAATGSSFESLATCNPASFYPLSWWLWNKKCDGGRAIPAQREDVRWFRLLPTLHPNFYKFYNTCTGGVQVFDSSRFFEVLGNFRGSPFLSNYREMSLYTYFEVLAKWICWGTSCTKAIVAMDCCS